jgi:hypothetical protein
VRGERDDARGNAKEFDSLRNVPAKDLRESIQVLASEYLKPTASGIAQAARPAGQTVPAKAEVHARVSQTNLAQLDTAFNRIALAA